MPRNLSSAFLSLARRWPEKIAIESATKKMTFSEMMKAAGAVSEALTEHKIGDQDRFGIAMTRNEDAFIVMLAAWLLGKTALVIDFRARAAERSKLAEVLDLSVFVEDRPAPGKNDYSALHINVTELCGDLEQRSLPSPPGANASPVAVIGVSSGTSRALHELSIFFDSFESTLDC